MSEREDVMYSAVNERFKNKRSQILTSLSDRFGAIELNRNKTRRVAERLGTMLVTI